jgi:osmoprotectant transport system substrate-binding protein
VRTPLLRRLAALLGAGLLATVTAGCGLGTSAGFTPSAQLSGPLAKVKSLNGLSIGVGSKNFTEQLVLGKMAVILLKSAGADVQDLTNIPGSTSAREAELQNVVGMEWEYTGTAWIEYLGHDNPIPSSHGQYEAVRKEDLAKHQLSWLPPAPMNDTYGFATTSAKAKKLGVSTLDDIKKLPTSERTFCVESEFKTRNDGFQPMLAAYGLKGKVPSGNVKTLQTGAIYAATHQGVCNFGEVFTTDGRIKALNLSVLADNKHFFPIYSLSAVIRQDVLSKYPQLKQLFDPVAAKLTNKTLTKLNEEVDVEGKKPSDVAYAWLKKEHFVS